jgi:hypothetical protein
MNQQTLAEVLRTSVESANRSESATNGTLNIRGASVAMKWN